MKVLLYTEGLKTIGKSGLGKAIKHQMKALENEKIEYTTNPKDDYDILHINTYFLKSYFLAKKARRLGKKVVYHAHSTEEDFRDGFIFCRQVAPLFKKWIMKCYSLGDVIITPTPYSKRLLDGYKMNREIYAISNGIDLDLFKKDKRSGELFREKYGYKKTDKVIIGIGLYIERKGIVDFVELAKRMPEYKFIWFGYSPLSVATKIVRDAVNTKLDNLTFAGYVEQDMIKAALNGCDLYLFPTLEETEGIPIIEACAVEADAIIRDIPIFEDWLIDGENVYKAKDVDGFEIKIKKFFNGELKSVSKNAYKVAEDRDLNKIGKQLKGVYQKVLKMPEEKKVNKVGYFKTLGMFLATIVLIIGTFFMANKYKVAPKEYSRTMYYMDTYINATVYTLTEDKAKKTLDGIEEIYKKYDKLTNRYNKDSELSFIYNNNSTEKELTISSELYDLLEYGDSWYKDTDGLFNIYMGPLIDVWHKHNELASVPSIDELNIAKNSIVNVEFLGNNKIVNNHANIDLGAISKGYTTALVKDYLDKSNVKKYVINAGGNVIVGEHYNKDLYRIGITSPFKDANDLLMVLNLENKAIVTSGSYQRYYEVDGVSYGHIIDPNTLYPANNMVGVTVIADDSKYADALSTTLFLMPIEDGMKLVNSKDNVEAIWCYIIENENRCVKSNGFSKYE